MGILSYPYSLAMDAQDSGEFQMKIVHVKIMALTNTSIQKALEINKAVAIMKILITSINDLWYPIS